MDPPGETWSPTKEKIVTNLTLDEDKEKSKKKKKNKIAKDALCSHIPDMKQNVFVTEKFTYLQEYAQHERIKVLLQVGKIIGGV